MSRTESRLKCSVWENPDFLARTARAQRMYFLLTSQANLSLCGVVTITERRWAKSASDETKETVRESLLELEEHGYIVADYDTEEVWIRTFAHHDGVCRSPKTRYPAYRQLAGVASLKLREMACRALLAEGSPPPDWTPPDNILWIFEEPQVNTLCHTPSRFSGFGTFSVPSPKSQVPEPSPTNPPAEPAPGTGATHRGPRQTPAGGDLDLAHTIADACTGSDRPTVRTEAAQVVAWASTLDKRLVDEAVGWTKTQVKPPVLPRAVAAVIRAKAADHGIRLPAFQPTTPHPSR